MGKMQAEATSFLSCHPERFHYLLRLMLFAKDLNVINWKVINIMRSRVYDIHTLFLLVSTRDDNGCRYKKSPTQINGSGLKI